MQPIRVKKIRPSAILPTYGSEEAAGADLYACIENELSIAPGQTAFITTGLSMEIPKGYTGLICARSGLACKRGLAPANKVGVIDSDYRGEVKVGLINLSDSEYTVKNGDRIAQMVIAPVIMADVEEVSELDETERAAGGFGSTGRS